MAKRSKQMAYEQAKEQAMKAGICVADIVKVIKYDESKMIVDVQPLTKYPDEEKFERKPQILSVPVALVYGGGFVIRPVYEAGDLGFVVYLDRDSDSTIAKGGEADPNTERLDVSIGTPPRISSTPGMMLYSSEVFALAANRSPDCHPKSSVWQRTMEASILSLEKTRSMSREMLRLREMLISQGMLKSLEKWR